MADYTFHGELTEKQAFQHIGHAFELPEGCGTLELVLSYSPLTIGGLNNLLCLTLLSPTGFRGAGHRLSTPQKVMIEPDSATPGYLAGPLPAGRWKALLDTFSILPGEPCRYQIEVHARELPSNRTPASPRLRPGKTIPIRKGPAWYRGDLHTHTHHSDGDQDLSTSIQTARSRGLDFIALTDHNTISGLDEIPSLAEPDFLVIRGMELTTFWGHALSLGAKEWVDWRTGPGHSMAEIAKEVHAKGQIFVIAHPCVPSGPCCTGCGWEYTDVWPGPARFVEVWNGPWRGDGSSNRHGLEHWYTWLNQGQRMVGTTGTDRHSPRDPVDGNGYSHIYADELSENGILEALKRGHLYLSNGPELDFTCWLENGEIFITGDRMNQPAGVFHLKWEKSPPNSTIRVICDGIGLFQWVGGVEGSKGWNLPEGSHWCVVEVRDPHDDLLAVTNPIFTAQFLTKEEST